MKIPADMLQESFRRAFIFIEIMYKLSLSNEWDLNEWSVAEIREILEITHDAR